MSIRKKMAHGMLWVLLEKAGQQFLNLLIFLILARLLGPDEIGLAGLGAIFASLALIVIFGSVEAVISQRLTDTRSLSTLFWPVIAAGVGLSLITYGAARPFAHLMEQERLVGLLHLMALVPILMSASAIPTVLIQAQLEFRIFAVRALVSTVLGGAVGIILALKGYGAYAIVYQQVTKLIASNLILWPSAGWRPRLIFDPSLLRKILSPGVKLTGSFFVSFVEEQVPRILIGVVLGSRFVGFYVFAHRLFQSLRELLVMPILTVLFPALAKIRDDRDNVRRMVGQITFITAILILPALMGASALAPVYVPLFFGEKWVHAVPFLQLLLIAMIPTPFISILRELLRAFDMTRFFLRIQLLMTGLVLLLVFLLVQSGLEKMVTGILVVNWMLFPIVVGMISHKTGIPLWPAFRKLGATVLASVLMVAAILTFQHSDLHLQNPWLNLAVMTFGGAILYAATLSLVQYRQLKTISLQVIHLLKQKASAG